LRLLHHDGREEHVQNVRAVASCGSWRSSAFRCRTT
jgi:hypothetical protein